MKIRWISVVLCLVLLAALPLSVSAAWPYVVDDAGLLSSQEKADLIDGCIRFREETGMEIAIITVNSLGGKSARAYADDYFDAHYGTNGILLLISMGEREWYISTAGTAINAFEDADLMGMEDGLMKYLPDGRYFDAFRRFLNDADYYAANEKVSDFTASFVIALPAGAVIAGIVLLIMRGMMNSKAPKYSAEDYMVRGSYRLIQNQDMFLYSNISKIPRPQQTNSSSGSSGGSSVHRSSSGVSHGGRGGKF